jgi:hypothetical protein
MKQTMGNKKRTPLLHLSVNADFNWDSVETMITFYKAEIKKANDALNQLSIMDDAKQIVILCGKIKLMKKKLVRGW